MIAQQGRVITVDGEEAVIRIGATSGCPACDAGRGCGAGIFGRLLRNRSVSISVSNTCGARPGEAVQVGMSEARFLALVFRLYALPLLAGLAGAVAGYAIATAAGLDGVIADLLTLAAALVAAWAVLGPVRRALREFPLGSAVHLLRGTEVPTETDCMAPAAAEGRLAGRHEN